MSKSLTKIANYIEIKYLTKSADDLPRQENGFYEENIKHNPYHNDKYYDKHTDEFDKEWDSISGNARLQIVSMLEKYRIVVDDGGGKEDQVAHVKCICF